MSRTPFMERRAPRLGAGNKKTPGIGKTSCKDLPLHPSREGRAVRRGPAMSRGTCKTRPPRHGTDESNPFFTMSKIPITSREAAGKSCLVLGSSSLGTDCAEDQWEPRYRDCGWWSQTGSNRRPPACKAGALPTELWPRQVSGVRYQMSGRKHS